jgi:hypothetical protein
MVATPALVVAAPPRTSRILTVPDIRRASRHRREGAMRRAQRGHLRHDC